MITHTLPKDWKPADYNYNFDTSAEFEELGTQLDYLTRTLAVLADLCDRGTQENTVELSCSELAGTFLMLHDGAKSAAKRGNTLHKYVCNLWGLERLAAQRALDQQGATQ